MADPILDELWRVREMLVKKHGGFDGYWNYLQKLDQARGGANGGRPSPRSASEQRLRSDHKNPTVLRSSADFFAKKVGDPASAPGNV